MIRLAPALSAIAMLAACAMSPPVAAPPNPPFVDAMVARFAAEPVANPPASIWRYEYAGRPVWYVPARCCDVPGVVYAADGSSVCEPDGGITGRGDGRCPDFATARRDGVVVWRDPRMR